MAAARPSGGNSLGRLLCVVGTLGPIGRRLPAPGTWGSLAGLLYFAVFFRHARWETVVAWTVVLSVVAVFVCEAAAKHLGKSDPGEVILDEFIVMPLVFVGWRTGYAAAMPEWAALLAGFALFRFFDILKPIGIGRLQRWPGGWGIVADDFAAALAACGALHLGAAIWVLLR